ncbi:MAG: GNAT family N-acetyltransferase [Planctomycetota bacterium]
MRRSRSCAAPGTAMRSIRRFTPSASAPRTTACSGPSTQGGALVAAAAVHRVPLDKIAHRATITGVYTQPAHRRRGLSRALVVECIAWAERSPGVEQVQLAAHAGNVAALALYEDLGFVRWGVEPRALKVEGEYADEVHLVRML